MAANLAGGNMAIALLGNTIPTGAILVVLISTLGPISGAHFNPLVSLAALVNRTMPTKEAVVYVAVQFIGALLGIIIAHAMFDLSLLQASTTMRSGVAQWFAEVVASFGLLTVIFLSVRNVPQQVALNVGLYITAA
jgi:glycerol uptake facilitator-like aquaporin